MTQPGAGKYVLCKLRIEMLLSLASAKSCTTGPCSNGHRRLRNTTAPPANRAANKIAMIVYVRVKRGFDGRPPSGAFPVSAAEDMELGVRFHSLSCCENS